MSDNTTQAKNKKEAADNGTAKAKAEKEPRQLQTFATLGADFIGPAPDESLTDGSADGWDSGTSSVLSHEPSTLLMRRISPGRVEGTKSAGPSAVVPTFGGRNFCGIPTHTRARPAVQPKLMVGAANDPSEQEADDVAEQVMRMPAPVSAPPGGADAPEPGGDSVQRAPEEEEEIQTKPLAATIRPFVQRAIPKSEDEEVQRAAEGEDELQTKRVSAADSFEVGGDFEDRVKATGGGSPLPDETRTFMEPRFGADFSGVRVHAGSEASDLNRQVSARAFTLGKDIYLGEGKTDVASDGGKRLLAHELTHVVQQGGAGKIQRAESSSDGSEVQQRMQQRANEEIAAEKQRQQELEQGQEQKPQAESSRLDTAKLNEKKAELKPQAKPSVDRAAEQGSLAQQAAQKIVEKADAPPQLAGSGKEPALPEAQQTGEAQAAAQQAAGMAKQAFAEAASVPEPEPAKPVEPPEPAALADSAGMPLPDDPGTDSQMQGLFQKAQALRQQGSNLRARAAQAQKNAGIMQGNMELVKKGVSQSEQSAEKSRDHLTFRKELAGQARKALGVSEQKAAKVRQEAPGFVEKAAQGGEKTEAIASGAKGKAGENSSNTPQDAEAAGNARQQGQQLNQVSSDATTIKGATTATQEKAKSLTQEATQATAMNTQTAGKVATIDKTLDQTDKTLAGMTTQNTQAQSQVEGLVSKPTEMIAQARGLDQQGASLIQASSDMERQLHQAQRNYETGMSTIPPLRAAPKTNAPGGNGATIQRLPEEGRYEDRENVNLAEGLPDWLTGVEPASIEEQQAAVIKEQERRQQQIAQINSVAGGHFENLSAGQKVGIALELTGQNLMGSVSKIQWPGWGKLATMLIDPRAPLMGVVSGLSMMLSGAGNLLSGEQWAKDPLGNLLKSSADIATGLTIILGSITALAGVIILIMTALTILSFGTAAPITGPIIAFCATVLTTVGGWTVTVGLIALALQGLVLIKNLVDAATAQTAEDLQNQSDQITTDVQNSGNILLQVGMAKLAQAGGRKIQAGIAETLPATPKAYAKGMSADFWGGVKSAPGRVKEWVQNRFGRGPSTPGAEVPAAEGLAAETSSVKTPGAEPPETVPPEGVPPKTVPPEGAPGSPVHKAARWQEYQERGGTWDYERWSKTYELNMERATTANKAVDAYHENLGWGKREVTIDVEGVPRRLDIADEAGLKGVEYKTGYQTKNQSNLWELERDAILVKQGWEITWVVEGKASEPLISALKDAGIIVVVK